MSEKMMMNGILNFCNIEDTRINEIQYKVLRYI